MDCALTSLPDHRWQRSSSQSLENCLAGFCGKRSDYRSHPSCSGVFHHIHLKSSHTPSNSFPRKNELPSSRSEHRDDGKLQAWKSRHWTRLRASLSGLLLSSSRLLVLRLKYHSAGDESDTALYWPMLGGISWPKSTGLLLFNKELLLNFLTTKPPFKMLKIKCWSRKGTDLEKTIGTAIKTMECKTPAINVIYNNVFPGIELCRNDQFFNSSFLFLVFG